MPLVLDKFWTSLVCWLPFLVMKNIMRLCLVCERSITGGLSWLVAFGCMNTWSLLKLTQRYPSYLHSRDPPADAGSNCHPKLWDMNGHDQLPSIVLHWPWSNAWNDQTGSIWAFEAIGSTWSWPLHGRVRSLLLGWGCFPDSAMLWWYGVGFANSNHAKKQEQVAYVEDGRDSD